MVLLDGVINQRLTESLPSQKTDEVFEYLAFELGPTNANRRLVTIELERSDDADDSIEYVESREWQRPTVQLEVAARAS